MIAQIEVNTRCNHRCWYCQNAHYRHPPDQVMSLYLFRHILEEISAAYTREDLSVLSFAAYNEPTLDPYLRQRLRLLTDLRFTYWFISNGSGLTKDLVDFIVQERIAIVGFHFNLPAIDAEEYHAAVGAPAENALIIRDNLMYLFSNQEKIGAPISAVVHGDYSHTHKRNYRRVKAFCQPYEVEVSYVGVMNRAGMLNDVVHQTVDHQTDILECTAGYFSNLYIGVEGNIYLCCHDYYQKYTYGNLGEMSLSLLLHSEERKLSIREFMHHFCRHCPYARPLWATGATDGG